MAGSTSTCRALPVSPSRPFPGSATELRWIERNPLVFWKSICFLLAALVVFLPTHR